MNVCVFCSSSNGVDQSYFDAASELGRLLAEKGHDLVFGGANVGLMHRLAESAKKGGSSVIGIIPQKIYDKDLATTLADELIVTATMDDRKNRMREKSDAFIALPGGFGTLEEVLEVITLKQLDYHRKPVVFINTNGFFDLLVAHFEQSYSELFARENYRKLYHIATCAEEAVDYIEQYIHSDLGTKWFNVPQKQK
jgi:uncharacterized protein (TIGR00730 family)